MPAERARQTSIVAAALSARTGAVAVGAAQVAGRSGRNAHRPASAARQEALSSVPAMASPPTASETVAATMVGRARLIFSAVLASSASMERAAVHRPGPRLLVDLRWGRSAHRPINARSLAARQFAAITAMKTMVLSTAVAMKVGPAQASVTAPIAAEDFIASMAPARTTKQVVLLSALNAHRADSAVRPPDQPSAIRTASMRTDPSIAAATRVEAALRISSVAAGSGAPTASAGLAKAQPRRHLVDRLGLEDSARVLSNVARRGEPFTAMTMALPVMAVSTAVDTMAEDAAAALTAAVAWNVLRGSVGLLVPLSAARGVATSGWEESAQPTANVQAVACAGTMASRPTVNAIAACTMVNRVEVIPIAVQV